MPRSAPVVTLTHSQRVQLAEWEAAAAGDEESARRAKAMRLAADGYTNTRIAAEVRMDRGLVGKLRTDFTERGLAAVKAPKRGRPPVSFEDRVRSIALFLQEDPPDGATSWSTRLMAERIGISKSSVQAIWANVGLVPSAIEQAIPSSWHARSSDDTWLLGWWLGQPTRTLVFYAPAEDSPAFLSKPSCGDAPSSLFGTLEHHDGDNNQVEEWSQFLEASAVRIPDSYQLHALVDCRDRDVDIPGLHVHQFPRTWVPRAVAGLRVASQHPLGRSMIDDLVGMMWDPEIQLSD